MAEYTGKITRQRAKSTKPYERNNNNFMSKAKNWALSWFRSPTSSTRDSDVDAGPSREALSPSVALFPDHSTHPLLSNDTTTTQDDAAASDPTPTHTADLPVGFVSTASASSHGKNSQMNTANLRATLSMFEEVLLQDQQMSTDISTSSNDSWVAEEVEEEQESDTPSPVTQSSTESDSENAAKQQTLTMDDQSAPVGGAPIAPGGGLERGSNAQEHTVQFLSNPGFSSRRATSGLSSSSSTTSSTVRVAPKVSSGFSAELSQRLYSAPVVATSTPQLSPVREGQEEEMQTSVRGVGSPFQPVLPTPPLRLTVEQGMPSSAVSGLSTPIRAFTNESISRSPFRSPFYSGRTSFGGAASQQKMRVKRPRTESSPPVLAPLRVSVKATPMASPKQSVVTHTAKRIMDTLNSVTSPLSDARRMPMRGIPPEMQQAKRRRISEGPSSVLSPPPVTPLQKTKSQTPQIVPSERPSPMRSLVTASIDYTDDPLSTPSPCTATPTNPTTKITTSHFSLLSSSHTPSVLSGLKFSAPPIVRQQVSPNQPSSSQSSTTECGSQAASSRTKLFRAGGKMSRRSRAARNRHLDESEEEDEEGYTSLVAPSPRVALSLGQGGSLPSFTFHSQLISNKESTPSKLLAQSSNPPFQQSLSTIPPTFSFSKPVPLNDNSALSAATPPKMSFGFSAPKPHLSPSASSVTPPLALPVMSKPVFGLGQQPPSKTTPNPPLLKNMSVVDALRKAEYSQFVKTTRSLGASAKSEDVVDLTNSDDEGTIGTTLKKQVSLTRPEEKSAPKSGGLQLGLSEGLKVGSGLKFSPTMTTLKPFPQLGPPAGSWECATCLVNNQASDDKCVACSSMKPSQTATTSSSQGTKPKSSPFFSLSPPSDSWTCDTCLVPNKAHDVKCVACTTPKPGAEKAKNAAPPATGAVLSGTGGFKLSGGVSLVGGLKLGTGAPQLGGTSSSNEGFKLGAGVSLKESTSSGGFKLGGGISLVGTSNSSSSASGGLKLGTLGGGTSSGFKLGAGVSLGGDKLKPFPSLATSKDFTPGSSGGFKLVGASLSMPKTSTTDSKEPVVSSTTGQSGSGPVQWTCDTCWVSNKPEVSTCVACGASKPNKQSAPGKADSTKPGLQLGSSAEGGLKLGSGVALGSLRATTGGSASFTSLLVATSTTKASGMEDSATPKLQFGAPLVPTSGFKLVAPQNKVVSDIPTTNSTLGGSAQTTSNPLSGIKLGASAFGSIPQTTMAGSLTATATSNPLSGIKFGGAGITLGGTLEGSLGDPIGRGETTSTIATSNAPLAGIKFSVPPATTSSLTEIKLGSIATTSANPLTGIKLGGTLTTTSASSLTEIKLGGAVGTTSASPLTGIKLGGGLVLGSGLTASGGAQSTVMTTGNSLPGIKFGVPPTTASNNPLAGIKLGTSTLVSTTSATGPLTTGGLQQQASGLPKLMFGNATSSGTFRFSGAQQPETSQAPLLQFSATSTSTSSIFGGNTPSSSGLSANLVPKFGVPQGGLSLGTPATGDTSQAEMQSPDNEMNVEQDKPEQPAIPGLIFNTSKAQTSSNIFGGQTSQNQSTAFSFNPSNATGAFGTNSSFDFSAGSASNFVFGSAQNQSVSGSGSTLASAQPNLGVSQSSTSTGYAFNTNAGLNLNFGSVSQSPSFSANASSSTTPGRVIKKARRRQPK